MFLSIGMLKLNYFLADIFILSAEKQPIKLSWRKIECLLILCEKITVDDTGIPNFSELKEFCEAKMEEIKEKTLPGYKKQEL